MLSHFIENTIPTLTIGALVICAIYHSILFFYNRIKLLGTYSLYLWVSLLFLVLAGITKSVNAEQKIIYFTVNSTILWLSYYVYFRFILTGINPLTVRKSKVLSYSHRYLFVVPFFIFANVYSYFSPKISYFSLAALFFNGAVLAYGIFIIYILFKEKRMSFNSNILGGSICLILFNIFNGISLYNKGTLFGVGTVSYISLGSFTEIIFFSIAISHKMRDDLTQKYEALSKIKNQEFELQIEKKKLINALLANDFEVQSERSKAAMEQRTLISRKLHDELSGNLVALRYLIRDFKKKTNSMDEKERLTGIEEEINNIYKDTRNYSHELAKNIEEVKNNLAYDIPSCLKKIENQFSDIGLISIHSSYQLDDLNKLSLIQNNNLYFLLKESFANTIKHSNATNIWVNIQIINNICTVSFRDNGIGFQDTMLEGLGIKNMRQRAKDLVAEFKINTDDNGTTVHLEFNIGSPPLNSSTNLNTLGEIIHV